MVDILEAIVGFSTGSLAGVAGYAIYAFSSAAFQAYGLFNPLIAILGVTFALCSFFAGIKKAIAAGAFFALGILIAGFILGNFVISIAGVLSAFGLAFSFLRTKNSLNQLR